jgi:hypothetical protein
MAHFTLNPEDPESLKKLAFLIGDTMRSIDSIALAMVVLGKTFDRFFDDGDSTIGRQCLSGLVEQLDKPLTSCHFTRQLRAHLDGTAGDPSLELLGEPTSA